MLVGDGECTGMVGSCIISGFPTTDDSRFLRYFHPQVIFTGIPKMNTQVYLIKATSELLSILTT